VSRKKRPGPTPRRRTVAAPPPAAGPPAAHDDDHDHSNSLWVTSELAPTGVYITTVHLGDKVMCVLDRAAALRYASAFTQAIAYARYDASVFAQLMNIFKGDMSHVGFMIDQLRKDRPPLPADATAPLVLGPIVSREDHKPRLTLDDDRGRVATLEASAAEQHAIHVLELSASVDLDAAYVRLLKSTVGLEDPEARAMVGLLSRWRVD
jgi:hypothetical protein